MMRTYSSMVVLIAILLTITGCSSIQQDTPQPEISPTLTEIPEPTITPETAIPDGDFEYYLMVNDVERSYLLHIPSGLNNQQPVPVLFAFHGNFQTPKEMQNIYQFDEISDQEKFLVVYPTGIKESWNTGWEGSPHAGYALANNVDDVAFVRQIVSDLESHAKIDPKRIYAAGFSQGGMFVYRLGCEMSDTFASIASVSGNLLLTSCNPTQPVSIIHIHGLKDKSVNYSGGAPFGFPHVEEGIETWSELNNCTDSIEEIDEANGITHITYSPCQVGTSIELYTIDSGTHSYIRIGIPASETIWRFFVVHPKP